ncbi:hypothetical protein WMY93_024107 [Mugilogobius chulae]|uniref:Uncharacterized protein n=1 Tax=Mugilogobius chulae TaxID=88201 RepID=A0AAW0ND53_9GOBI
MKKDRDTHGEQAAAKKDPCDLHAAVGIRLTLPFPYEKLGNTEKLVWLHNDTVIYQQDKGKVSVGKPEDILPTGSLVLTNPKLASAGVYQAKVYNISGSLIKSWSRFLCRKGKEEPQMLSLTTREPETDYETMHAPEGSLESSPKPSPRSEHNKHVQEFEAPGESLQPATLTQGQDPSPVPKPRTKRPNTPDI